MSDKPKKKKSKTRSIVEWTLTIVFGIFFVIAGIGQIDGMIHQKDNYGQTLRFGWGSFVVLTDSMEPVYPVDSAIITYKESPEYIFDLYQKGENVDITFYNTGDYTDIAGNIRQCLRTGSYGLSLGNDFYLHCRSF